MINNLILKSKFLTLQKQWCDLCVEFAHSLSNFITLERRLECTLQLVVKEVVRELGNDQHVSVEANVFRFPFIFFNLSGFGTLRVTTFLLRGLFT